MQGLKLVQRRGSVLDNEDHTCSEFQPKSGQYINYITYAVHVRFETRDNLDASIWHNGDVRIVYLELHIFA